MPRSQPATQSSAARSGRYLLILFSIWFCSHCGQAQAEGCAGADDGIEVHRTVVPLHNLISLRQADSAAPFIALGGEIEFENFLLRIGRNAASLINDFGKNHVVVAPRFDGRRSP